MSYLTYEKYRDFYKQFGRTVDRVTKDVRFSDEKQLKIAYRDYERICKGNLIESMLHLSNPYYGWYCCECRVSVKQGHALCAECTLKMYEEKEKNMMYIGDFIDLYGFTSYFKGDEMPLKIKGIPLQIKRCPNPKCFNYFNLKIDSYCIKCCCCSTTISQVDCDILSIVESWNNLYRKGDKEMENYGKVQKTVEINDELTLTQKDIEKVGKSLIKFLIAKNKNYGNSALEPLRIFSKHINTSITNNEDIRALNQMLTRLDDKLSRIKNAKELRKNDVSDILGYLILVCVNLGWDNFDELVD